MPEPSRMDAENMLCLTRGRALRVESQAPWEASQRELSDALADTTYGWGMGAGEILHPHSR